MSLFEKAISLINKLILIRNKQNEILLSKGNSKESTALTFKIKNYKKWIEKLDSHIQNKTIINNKEDIIKLEFTDKLTIYIIELYETGNIKEIDIENAEFDKMIKKDKKDKINNKIEKDIEEVNPSIDTSTIEAKPKILNDEIRPSDLRGGSIFDLRYIHGIGPANAIKLYDNHNVTLEGLLSEWKEWISKDISNNILSPSKMSKPKQYTKSQWDLLNKDNQTSILETNLKKKLDTETKQLCKLHKSSLIGIKHFHDMSLKIPREEIQKAESILKKLALHMNKDLIVTICGSYRRGRDKSGDVDCLIAHPLIKTKLDLDNNPNNLLHNFVKLLSDSNFIVDQLDMGTKKFMGFCNIMQFIKINSSETKESLQPKESLQQKELKHIARRIDIRFVPYESYGSAILYFTGSKTFNTDMRKHSLKKGYSLNEFGLTKISDGTIIPCYTEEEIFKILNYPYKKPQERDI